MVIREASPSGASRTVPPPDPPPEGDLWGDIPYGIRQQLHQVSSNDPAGWIKEAQTSADLATRKKAEEKHSQTTSGLRRQNEEVKSAISVAESELADLHRTTMESELRLSSLRKREHATAEVIVSADFKLIYFLRDLRPAALQPPAQTATFPAALQPLVPVTHVTYVASTTAASQPPTQTLHTQPVRPPNPVLCSLQP